MEVDSAATVVVDSRNDEDTVVLSTHPATQTTLILPPPPRSVLLQFGVGADARLYWDRSHYSSPAAQMEALTGSATLYVGNLAFTTRSAHVTQHFWQLGPVKRVIMGLDRLKKTPCGFCFVEYWHRPHAVAATALLSGTKLDGRVIRVELDAGFQPGRQYGRGVSGGQVRDDAVKRNITNKRTRSDSEYSGTSSSKLTPLPPVTLDGALPSARHQQQQQQQQPIKGEQQLPSGVDDDYTNKMEEDDAPAAKRPKRE